MCFTLKINQFSVPSVLEVQIESDLYGRKGAAIDNFAATLPLPQADLVRETLKSPYNFEFLTLDQEVYGFGKCDSWSNSKITSRYRESYVIPI